MFEGFLPLIVLAALNFVAWTVADCVKEYMEFGEFPHRPHATKDDYRLLRMWFPRKRWRRRFRFWGTRSGELFGEF